MARFLLNLRDQRSRSDIMSAFGSSNPSSLGSQSLPASSLRFTSNISASLGGSIAIDDDADVEEKDVDDDDDDVGLVAASRGASWHGEDEKGRYLPDVLVVDKAGAMWV